MSSVEAGIGLFLIVVSLLLSILALTELSSRVSLKLFLNDELSRIQSAADLVDIAPEASRIAEVVGESDVARRAVIFSQGQLRRLEESGGVGNTYTLGVNGIRSVYALLLSNSIRYSALSARDSVFLAENFSPSELGLLSPEPSLVGSVERILGLSQLPSDLILALLLASSAALGSLYAVLRAPNERYIKAFFTGIIAGFIAYLAIKGGRAVLFVETTVVSPLGFNPFSMAFVGVIVGLFTEKAYSVLSDLADEAGERLVRKSKDGGSK